MVLAVSGEDEYPFQTEICIIAGFLFLKGCADESMVKVTSRLGAKAAAFQLIRYQSMMKVVRSDTIVKTFQRKQWLLYARILQTCKNPHERNR